MMSQNSQKDRNKLVQIAKASHLHSQTLFSPQMTSLPLDPLLFYLRDHELYYTALSGPRYNEYAIFIDFHEWELSSTCSFYQYLKIIKAYQALLQTINGKPVLVILPTGYIETCRWFSFFSYWKDYDLRVLHFVQRIIPDVHICPQDFISYQVRYFPSAFKARCYIQNSCLQMVHFNHSHKPKHACQIATHYNFECTLLKQYRQTSREID